MSTELHKIINMFVILIGKDKENKQISRKTRAKQRTFDIKWWQRVENLKTENP